MIARMTDDPLNELPRQPGRVHSETRKRLESRIEGGKQWEDIVMEGKTSGSGVGYMAVLLLPLFSDSVYHDRHEKTVLHSPCIMIEAARTPGSEWGPVTRSNTSKPGRRRRPSAHRI